MQLGHMQCIKFDMQGTAPEIIFHEQVIVCQGLCDLHKLYQVTSLSAHLPAGGSSTQALTPTRRSQSQDTIKQSDYVKMQKWKCIRKYRAVLMAVALRLLSIHL